MESPDVPLVSCGDVRLSGPAERRDGLKWTHVAYDCAPRLGEKRVRKRRARGCAAAASRQANRVDLGVGPPAVAQQPLNCGVVLLAGRDSLGGPVDDPDSAGAAALEAREGSV